MNSSDSITPEIKKKEVSERSQLRNDMRTKRRALTAEQQDQAARNIQSRILEDPDFKQAQTMAFYQAFDGEIDPSLAVQIALELGKRCFLPVIDPKTESMTFTEYKADAELEQNAFGILEPKLYPNDSLAPEHIDLIFMPLVAFDQSGTRLGMGKGYYDRKLAFLAEKSSEMSLTSGKIPVLVGLAHECQRVEKLERAEWDIPLDKILTDQAIYTTFSTA
jgi:5-formyltetrahydrofolate cyclo-ligase